jgi:hypothetical protein
VQGTTILDHKVINLFMLKRFRVSLAKVKMAKSFFSQNGGGFFGGAQKWRNFIFD